MSARPRGILRMVFALVVVALASFTLSAQEAVPLPHNIPGPPVPVSKGPVSLFRSLLAMDGPERAQFLAKYPDGVRQRLLEKVREYEAMKPEDREERLRVTALRWYLMQFMRTPATNRTEQVELVPEADRRMVVERLQYWDKLPPEQQQEVLEYESTLQYLVGREAGKSNAIPADFPAEQRAAMTKSLDRWNSLSLGQRDAMSARFQRFFELTEEERQRNLRAFSEPERRQMEKTLQRFAQLPAERREQCLKAFNKFASMSGPERDEFLKNAERWREMSLPERQAWRNLVLRVPPLPLPPPPLPPGLVPGLGPQNTLVTNGGQ